MNKKKLLIITILFSFILVGCVATKKDNDEDNSTVVSYKCQLVEEDNDTTYLTKIRIYFDEDTITKMEIDKITETIIPCLNQFTSIPRKPFIPRSMR